MLMPTIIVISTQFFRFSKLALNMAHWITELTSMDQVNRMYFFPIFQGKKLIDL